MGINLQIYELKKNLTEVINNATLPASVIQMVLGEIKEHVDEQAACCIEMERKAYYESTAE